MERWSGGEFAGDGCCGRGACGGIGDWLRGRGDEGRGIRDEGWEGLRRVLGEMLGVGGWDSVWIDADC